MTCTATVSGSCDEIIFESDNLAKLLDALDNSVDPAVAITGATVTAEFFEQIGGAWTTFHGPIALTEIPTPPSNDYQGSYDASAANGFSVGQRVRIVYDFDGGAGLTRQFVIIVIVVEG